MKNLHKVQIGEYVAFSVSSGMLFNFATALGYWDNEGELKYVIVEVDINVNSTYGDLRLSTLKNQYGYFSIHDSTHVTLSECIVDKKIMDKWIAIVKIIDM